MAPLNNINNNGFGMLFQCYMNAIPIDAIVLCVTTAIDVDQVNNLVERIKTYDKDIKVYIVISHISYQELSFNSIAGPDIYSEGVIEQKLYYEQLVSKIQETKCYLINDVDNGDLLRQVVNDFEA